MNGVILYKCGQNINRAYRLCYTFGVHDLFLLDCDTAKTGNVFSAKDKVTIHHVDSLDGFFKVAALEKGKGVPIDATIADYDYILVGGENVTLTNKMASKFYHIDTQNSLCLTVDEALAIGLHYATR